MSTPETYCGYLRGNIANTSGLVKDKVYIYVAPKEVPRNFVAINGPFLSKHEYVESINPDSELLLNFQATEVNLVIHPVNNQSTIEVNFKGDLVNKGPKNVPTLKV